MQNLLANIRRALAWFIEGLTQAVSDIEDKIRARVPVRLVDVGGGAYAVEGPDGVRERDLVRAGANGIEPPSFAQKVEDRDVVVVLPPDELLVRTLDPLPAESKQYIDGIVRHQLERLVPWRADNVLYTYKAEPGPAGDNKLHVTVSATAKNLHAALFNALAALSPRHVRLLYPAVERAGGDVSITLNGGVHGGAHRAQLRLSVLGGLAALETTQNDVADLRKKLAARGPQGPAGDREAQAIMSRKKAQPAMVFALDKLSTALPDDTWLTDLNLNNEGQLRITGTSQNVADLVPQLQAAAIFADPTFFSPTTRLPAGGDRFNLQMKLTNPPGAGK